MSESNKKVTPEIQETLHQVEVAFHDPSVCVAIVLLINFSNTIVSFILRYYQFAILILIFVQVLCMCACHVL